MDYIYIYDIIYVAWLRSRYDMGHRSDLFRPAAGPSLAASQEDPGPPLLLPLLGISAAETL